MLNVLLWLIDSLLFGVIHFNDEICFIKIKQYSHHPLWDEERIIDEEEH